MNRLAYIVMVLLAFSLGISAQKRKTTAKKKTTSRVISKKTSRKAGANVSTASIKGLQRQRDDIKRNIKNHEQKLRNNERDVKKRLQNLLVINSEIEGKRKTIDTIRRDISVLDGDISRLNEDLKKLNAELDVRKGNYVKSMRYMHRNSSIQSRLMFVFSARNFSQMYRRMRFMREYASYQKAQGEMVKTKQAQITERRKELSEAKVMKNTLLSKGEQEQRSLEGKQTEQRNVVKTLQKQQKTIQNIIVQQRKKDAELNKQIDRLIAIEVEKARARAAAEAKRQEEARRKAAEEAERKRKEEIARKKAEAEAAARENARRVAEAKTREEQAKAAAAASRNAKEKAEKEALAKRAEKERRDAERNAADEAREHAKEVEKLKSRKSATLYTLDSDDRRISGSFESNRGHLPMPVAGSCRIVSHYGQYNVEGLSNVRLDNKGINILGNPGSKVCSIFDGEVSAVFNLGGVAGVMVRHGSYISVYCNLGSISVHKGQKVKSRQVLGTVGADNILQFQLRREKAKLNPEAWLRR
ncbi:murein hydrolase activator EnvC family protein [Xylanibacter muris]|uniref:Peptidoglycan DD-metalloendopeptidase family protein n=1 Tax=Xylanibacter muris TaxID=2736290 RepID=A0ABX2AQU9_9BACT|nr:peptidoglycan DD-metalloendopeptidase family protein [Xylanibacter muris]NPD92594.1 peptidoglycan DD-metalloendopeptidase family protein [Xylanibacter muris]